MRCWYQFYILTTAAIVLICIRISKCSKTHDDSLTLPDESAILNSADNHLELDIISMPKLTLTDENGLKLELEVEKSGPTENKIPLHDATNILKLWPKSRPNSKSDRAELGTDNDSNIFSSKVTYNDNGYSILKSLRKSKCQRERKETDKCQSVPLSNINLHNIQKDNPPSPDSVDGLKQDILRASVGTNEPQVAHVNSDKAFVLPIVTASVNIVDEIDGLGSTAILQAKSRENNGQPAEFRDQLRLPDCSDRANDNRFPVLVVSTLDGHISGIDFRNGVVLWSHPTGDAVNPLLSSSMSKIEVTSRGEWVRLIPSLDGGIYRFDGDNVEALPITADTLLHSSFKFNEDTIFTGGKDSEIIGINPFTGNLIYSCNSNGCTKKFSTANSGELLVIKRVSQTVRAIDPKTGNERWNFSVGMHEANVANSACESLDSDLEFEKKSLTPLRFVLPEGLIIGLDEHSQMLWRQKMSSPIVSAWNLIGNDLEQINLFSSASVPALLPEAIPPDVRDHHGSEIPNKQPSLYVGVHQKQLYIQQNEKFQKDFSNILQRFTSTGSYGGDMSLPKIQWQPYLATALSRTPVIHHDANHHPLLLDYDRKEHNSDLVVKHKFDYPYDNGYYLYGKDTSVLNDSDHWPHVDEDYQDSEFIDESFINKIYYVCFEVGPQTLWKICLGIFAYTAFHWMCFRYFVTRHAERMTNYINDRAFTAIRIMLHHTFRENPQVLAIIQRLGILQLLPPPAPPPPPPPPPPSEPVINNFGQSSPGSPLTSSQDGHDTQRQDSNYSSRYTSDFEPICCLGRGGFGVVFQVKNTLDENEYAVKRIVLPKKESSAERVKREARALAKLNHTNIVRYYQSWLETPPVGWEKEADVWWKQGDAVSSVFLSPDVDETENKKFSFPLTSEPAIKKMNSNTLSGIINNLVSTKLPSKFTVEPVSDSSEDENCDSSEDENCDSRNLNISFDNEDISEVSDSGEIKNSFSYCENDDSLDVIFQEESSSQINVKKNTLNLTSLEDEDSVVFQNDSSEGNGAPLNEQYSNMLDSKSIENLNENDKIPKSDAICIRNGRETSRGRFNSLCTGSKIERPTSLDLALSSSDPCHSRLVKHLVKDIATPNPRTYLYIQMELCKKESLKEWLANNLDRDSLYNQILNFFTNIVEAVEYVHDRALMHRDLKPSNIFFSLDGEIKVGDFGLVTTIEEENNTILTPMDDFRSKKSGDQPHDNVAQRTLNAGTHLYMSPEQMCGKKYNYKIDIFSLGLIFFEMLVPFSTQMERNDVMKKARYRTFPEGFEEKYVDESSLLLLALHNNPDERPTTRGIRARKPLASLQRDLSSISPEEHFSLAKVKGHWRSHSGSFTLSHSSSVSSA